MKLLKVKIARDQSGGRTHYTYPPEYKAERVQFGPTYESSLPVNYDVVVARGNTDEYCIIGVSDADAPGFLASADIDEVDETEYRSLGNSWTKQVEKITDQSKVLQICAKAAQGIALSQDEKNALDPDNAETGINKSKSFDDRLTDNLAKGVVRGL